MRNAVYVSNGDLHLLLSDRNTGEIVYSINQTNWTKTFVIDHPIKKKNFLVHACLEGPEAGVYYRGKVTIPKGKEEIKVFLPDYTSAWCDFTVNVTAIGKPRICGSSEVNFCSFEIYGDPGVYHWTVYAKRSEVVVEPLKECVTVNGEGPYRWIS
jgi:hypothetical protein